MKITIYLTLSLFFCLSTNHIYAQVTIGSDKKAIHGALLQVKEFEGHTNSTKGIGLPRVELEDLLSLKPCLSGTISESDKADHIGLWVYNVTTDLDKNLCPGNYVWLGASEGWTRLNSDSCSRMPATISLKINPNSWHVSKNGGSKNFIVTANIPWTMSLEDSNSTIKSISPTSGPAGTTSVSAIVDSTNTYGEKTAKIEVKPTNPSIQVSDSAIITQDGVCEYYQVDNWEFYCIDLIGSFDEAKNICSSIVPITNPSNPFMLLPFGSQWTIYSDWTNFPAGTYWIGNQPQPGGGQMTMTISYPVSNHLVMNLDNEPNLNQKYLVRCARQM